MKKLIIATLFLVTGFYSAHAGGLTVPKDDDSYSSPKIFQGFYAGISVDAESTDIFKSSKWGTSFSEANNYNAGLHLGYDHQIGNVIVIGARVGYSTSLDGEGAFGTEGVWNAIIRGGFKANEALLLYGLAGYEFRDLKNDLTPENFVYGAGVEYAVTRNMRFFLEGTQGAEVSEGPYEFDTTTVRAGINFKIH